jgi:hypothetical protein
MPTLRELADQIGKLFAERSRLNFRASLAVKILVTLAAIVAAIAQSFELSHAIGAVSPWSVTGIAAAVLIALGGLYLAFAEQDASVALEAARDAIGRAREYNEQIGKFERVQLDVRRVSELYAAIDAMGAQRRI